MVSLRTNLYLMSTCLVLVDTETFSLIKMAPKLSTFTIIGSFTIKFKEISVIKLILRIQILMSAIAFMLRRYFFAWSVTFKWAQAFSNMDSDISFSYFFQITYSSYTLGFGIICFLVTPSSCIGRNLSRTLIGFLRQDITFLKFSNFFPNPFKDSR